ncbi:MAG: hypothetical protein JNK02_13615 [Planctomycetes bacterium]|nr:hypothetical protein [Planctomycetota bacterium]
MGEYERLAREILRARHPSLLARLERQGLLGPVLALLGETGTVLCAAVMRDAEARTPLPTDEPSRTERLRGDSATAREIATQRLAEAIDSLARGDESGSRAVAEALGDHAGDVEGARPEMAPPRPAPDAQATVTRPWGDSGTKEVPGANRPSPVPEPSRTRRQQRLARALEVLAGEFRVGPANTDDAQYERAKAAFDAVASRIRRDLKDPDALIRAFVAFLVRQPGVDPGILHRMYPYLERYAAGRSRQEGEAGTEASAALAGGSSASAAALPSSGPVQCPPARRIPFAPPGTNPAIGWIHAQKGQLLTRPEYRQALKDKVFYLVAKAGVPGSSIPADLSPPLEPTDSAELVAERLWVETPLGSLLGMEVDKVRTWPVRVPSEPKRIREPLDLAALLSMASDLG